MGETDTIQPTVILPENQTTCVVVLSAWMPIAREIIAVQFSCVGLWLWQRFNGRGLATGGILVAINIPHYEELARCINVGVPQLPYDVPHAHLHHPRQRVPHRHSTGTPHKSTRTGQLAERPLDLNCRRCKDFRLRCHRVRHRRRHYPSLNSEDHFASRLSPTRTKRRPSPISRQPENQPLVPQSCVKRPVPCRTIVNCYPISFLAEKLLRRALPAILLGRP